MEIRIQAIHFDASEKLEKFIQKKVSKLEQYYDGIIAVEVSLKVVKPETAQNKEAGIKVLVPVSYTHLRAHETGRNLVCRLLLEKKKTYKSDK